MHWIDLSDWIHGETGGYLRYSHREPQLVRDRLPEVPRARPASRSPSTSAPTSTPATSSRRWRPAAPTAATSTCATAASSPTCPPTASSRAPASSTASASTWSRASPCRSPAPPPARPSSTSSAWRSRPRSPATSTLLKQAVLHDPLVGAICTPDEVWQMVDELLVAQAQWLPQYADAIPAAEARLRSPTVRTRDWSGAARQRVRSVEELRAGQARRGRARRSAPSSWAEANAFTSRRQPDRACKPLLACPHISSRTSVSRPVIAAAAAIAGREQVGAPAAALPALEVAVRGRGAALAGRELVGVHAEAHRAAGHPPVEAGLDQLLRRCPPPRPGRARGPSPARSSPGGPSLTRRPSITFATSRRSSIRPLVQEPMKTVSIAMSCSRVPGRQPHVVEAAPRRVDLAALEVLRVAARRR